MRKGLVAVAAIAAIAACSSPPTGPSPVRTTAAQASVTPDWNRYVGAYTSADGTTWVTNASGHLLNLRDSTFRQLYATARLDRFTIGPAFAVSTPKQADVSFQMNGLRAASMSLRSINRLAVAAIRAPFKATDVRIQADGAVLAGTVTEPLSSGPHPGIVIIHGSEPGQRFYYGIWVGFYASLGMTVLSYDKRGHGESTGTYPGEYASQDALSTYADDATAALRFLAGWPGVDPQRVGFHGGSQGGWTVPLAIHRYHAPAAFAVLLSAPAVTVDQQDAWAAFSGGSSSMPTLSESEMDARVRSLQSTGYDPRPVLAAIALPILWLNGAADRQVPTTVNAEILRSYHRDNWDIEVLPRVDHGLFENPSGLTPDETTATRLAPGIWRTIAAWLEKTAGSMPLP